MDAKPLRILIIVNLPWDERLGATRVWMELAGQWRARGHTVEKFSLSDAYPGVRAARVTFALRQLRFLRKAAKFVRQNGHRFDVIDALIGTLPYSKQELGFRGIIVARSVGLYRLYDQFEQSVQQRWPRPKQGKLIGRLLYSFLRRRSLGASTRAVQQADAINVPNGEEAASLREDLGCRKPIIVLPYGLTEARQRAFRDRAAPPATRVAQKRICFIGMWSPRKGSYDWGRIITAVRQEVPDARFRFLGTMVDEQTIRTDLGAAATGDIELISDYQPDELPALLADCTVGAFPSYVEGFGLAVLEQLTAGLPTVAYDTAGPRDMLHARLPESLVPSGDIDGFAAALVRVLRLEVEAYRALSTRSAEVGATFRWPEIAEATLSAYQRLVRQAADPIVFVQPFSIGSAGGGARILRALLEQAPMAWRSICSSPDNPRPWPNEEHVRSRPWWGRIEHTRLAAWPQITTPLFARRYLRRLKQCCAQLGARAIHAVPHAGLDFSVAQSVARELSLPFFISLHDDLAYTASDGVPADAREAAMRSAWCEASARFVISDALGQEYGRRYGHREFQVVTDGLVQLTPTRTAAAPGNLRIYFMGLFHMTYEQNLRAFLEGVALFERATPTVQVDVTLRCEHVRPQVFAGTRPATVLPFADEAQVQRDMAHADLLYMPIPFGEEHENFARYSLSTKMVTYLGSGLPILYHGPTTSAAYQLLDRHGAAALSTTLVPEEIAAQLQELDAARRHELATRALALAEREFMLEEQTRRFWGTISGCLTRR